MGNEKGQSETPSFTIGLVIMLLILLALGLVTCNIAEKNVDVRSQIFFEDFFNAYLNCTSFDGECMCGDVDMGGLPGRHYINVADLEEDKVGIGLYKGGGLNYEHGGTDSLMWGEMKGGKICEIKYDSEEEEYKKEYLDEYQLWSSDSFDYHLVKLKDGVCFVYKTETVSKRLRGSYNSEIIDKYPLCGEEELVEEVKVENGEGSIEF